MIQRTTVTTTLVILGLLLAAAIFSSSTVAQPPAPKAELQVGRFQMVANPQTGSPDYYIIDTATGQGYNSGGGTTSQPKLKR